MPFGQLVIGPPGSGKTTYCLGMQQFLEAMGRKPVIVNLDFANDLLPYTPAIDVSELVSMVDVMTNQRLGPNGALLYCMEHLNKNFDWLSQKIKAFDPESYFVFDCPGQVELFICHNFFKDIVRKIERENHFRLAAVHLADSFYLNDPAKFISVLILSLQAMLQLELPHINILSKIDNILSFGLLQHEIEQYAEPSDLTFLVVRLGQSQFGKKHKKLTEALCELIDDFGMISFIPFAVEDKECMAYALQEIDKANGHVFGSLTAGNESIMEAAMSSSGSDKYLRLIQERYCTKREEEEQSGSDEERYN